MGASRVLVVGVLAALGVLAGCGAGESDAGASAPEDPSVVEPDPGDGAMGGPDAPEASESPDVSEDMGSGGSTGSGDMGSGDDLEENPVQDFVEECEKAGAVASRQAQVTWPRTLELGVNEAVVYQVAVDVQDVPLPPEDVVQTGEADRRTVWVQCRLSARLVAADEWLVVPDPSPETGGWVASKFATSGVLQWGWNVGAKAPGTHHLRLEIQPVATTSDGDVTPGERLVLVTEVDVDGTPLHWAWFWVEQNRGAATGLAVAGAGAVLWSLSNLEKVTGAWGSWRGRRRPGRRPPPPPRARTPRATRTGRVRATVRPVR